MRAVPEDLAARLGGATTLARCWRLTRRDGLVRGFTDHDRDLAFEGMTFHAGTGLEAAEAAAEIGFAVGGGEVAGALDHAGLSEDDLAAGLYDGARVETFLVDWRAPEARMLLDIGFVGEVRRADAAFVAELRSLMHRLDEPAGRTYGAACDATLGDARCRVDLSQPGLSANGIVTASDGAISLASPALAGFPPGFFTGGRLVWTGGANAGGGEASVRAHHAGGLDLWQRAARPIAPGDAFQVSAGCDGSFATCRAKFANAVNFQGFPHMPGNDFVVRLPAEGEAGLDGGSLFR